LFAEEILSFLTERGVLRTKDGNLEFDVGAVGAALPASVQSLLTARVDRLTPQDRGVLQAASVIGRRFDPQLLSVQRIWRRHRRRLAAAGADLLHSKQVRRLWFKHALGETRLQSLLTGPAPRCISKLHEEIERRSGNRSPRW